MVSSISSTEKGGKVIVETSPPRQESSARGTRQISPAKHWCLTWNNYSVDWLEKFHSSKIEQYVLGREVGESGTPHIQGYVKFFKKERPKSVIDSDQIHWEKCRNIANAIAYCQKDGDYEILGLPRPQVLEILAEKDFYPWQAAAMDKMRCFQDNRKIFWIWEAEGNVGKSAFVKHIVHHRDAMICSGKASDMKYLIAKFIKEKSYTPEIVIFDVPRSNLQYISFQGIEEIKNGCFASTKYDCEMILMNSPHLFIFANEPPWEHMGMYNGKPKMSLDRWEVYKIDDKQLIPDKFVEIDYLSETLSVFT